MSLGLYTLGILSYEKKAIFKKSNDEVSLLMIPGTGKQDCRFREMAIPASFDRGTIGGEESGSGKKERTSRRDERGVLRGVL